MERTLTETIIEDGKALLNLERKTSGTVAELTEVDYITSFAVDSYGCQEVQETW